MIGGMEMEVIKLVMCRYKLTLTLLISTWSEFATDLELQPGQGVDLEAKTQRGRGADSTKCAANNLC